MLPSYTGSGPGHCNTVFRVDPRVTVFGLLVCWKRIDEPGDMISFPSLFFILLKLLPNYFSSCCQ